MSIHLIRDLFIKKPRKHYLTVVKQIIAKYDTNDKMIAM